MYRSHPREGEKASERERASHITPRAPPHCLCVSWTSFGVCGRERARERERVCMRWMGAEERLWNARCSWFWGQYAGIFFKPEHREIFWTIGGAAQLLPVWDRVHTLNPLKPFILESLYLFHKFHAAWGCGAMLHRWLLAAWFPSSLFTLLWLIRTIEPVCADPPCDRAEEKERGAKCLLSTWGCEDACSCVCVSAAAHSRAPRLKADSSNLNWREDSKLSSALPPNLSHRSTCMYVGGEAELLSPRWGFPP